MARLVTGNRVALLGLATVAVAALGNGLDRASAAHPHLARYVPAPFAAEAWRTRAAATLGSGQDDHGIAAAEAAVLADPVDPRSAALLGAGNLAAGKPVRADQAFRVAARFGWRDPLTQLYLMNAALNEREPRLAALRLDAVLRQAPTFPVRDMLIAQFFAAPGGGPALAERLSLRPAWTAAFLGDRTGLSLAALDQRARLVAAMPPPQWGCGEVAGLVQRLIQQGGAQTASVLWRAQCPLAAAGIADPHFRNLPADRQPTAFEWNLPGDGNVSAAPDPSGTGLAVTVGGPVARPVAWQLLVMPAGRYRLQWQASAGGKPATNVTVSISCNLTQRQPVPAGQPGADATFVAPVVLEADCPAHFLTVWAAPSPSEIRFDGPAIKPLP